MPSPLHTEHGWKPVSVSRSGVTGELVAASLDTSPRSMKSSALNTSVGSKVPLTDLTMDSLAEGFAPRSTRDISITSPPLIRPLGAEASLTTVAFLIPTLSME